MSDDSRRAATEARHSTGGAAATVPLAPSRVVIEIVRPCIDAGRFPIKRVTGETVDVVATLFADGHDIVTAVLRDRCLGPVPPASREGHTPDRDTEATGWREMPMRLRAPGTDEWTARFEVSALGWHEYVVVAWVDRFRTWRQEIEIKSAAGSDVSLELLEGAQLVRDTAQRTPVASPREAVRPIEAERRADAVWLMNRAGELAGGTPAAERVAAALDPRLAALMDRYADRSRASTSGPLRVWVDRPRARFGSWYEMFPRSAGPDPRRSATFAEAAAVLPYVADLGFDVLYLPPIHPIGRSFRKGRNNVLSPAPGDPGSPWAIGSAEGGHTAIEPGLGTLDDFEAFRREAAHLGLEIALDLAWQCSPDHPWVREHPDWFRHRPDGTIKYAENPPKKYQDIYPLDFDSHDWQALWAELLRVTRFWIDRGVRIFRVDNPHTKTFAFWEWLIGEVHRRDPDVIFLAEAFTRPAVMRYLAKAGFTQSYTYFTWRNSKAELVEYFTELTATDVREYLRPNLFANTPDILHAFLQDGGRPAFEARLLLAATLGASYGIYSGFELAENRALRPGSEEYADSEKYQYRQRDWNRPGHVKELVSRLNHVRREHRALQQDWTLRFHDTDNPEIIAYSKSEPDGSRPIIAIVNLDPQHMQHGHVRLPIDLLRSAGAAPDAYDVVDLLDDAVYSWREEWNYVRFDPGVRQGHVLRLADRV
jgi:starch synthase (maltosyl-transferring)